MNRVKFSVITVVYNGASVLKSCMDSVGGQQGTESEHIVVDGGSTDGSVDLLKASQWPALRWISEPDRGIADAMNKGARMARGNWLLFLQADDRLSDTRSLASVMELCEGLEADLLGCGINMGERCLLPTGEGKSKMGWPPKSPFKQPFRHQGLLISKSAWERVGPYRIDFKITMDFDWMLRAYWLGIKAARIGMPLADVGTSGISSAIRGKAYRLRLQEEQRARQANAPNRAWRLAYNVIWPVYLPYRLLRTLISGL